MTYTNVISEMSALRWFNSCFNCTSCCGAIDTFPSMRVDFLADRHGCFVLRVMSIFSFRATFYVGIFK